MSGFIDKLANRVFDSVGYKKSSADLFSAYVQGLTGNEINIERNDIKKLVSSAQILYKSNDEFLRSEGTVLLSMILDVCAKHHVDIVPIAKNIFSGAGDFPNIQLLEKRYPNLEFKYHLYSEAEMNLRLDLNTVEDLDFPLTDFQRSLWNDLRSDEDVITAAPTSAGKTHIILNYLLKSIVKRDGAFIAIIVPTRALISEVAAKVYELAKACGCENEIEICTIPRDKGEGFGAKTFFIMTQERIHEILLRGDIYFDFLFIDEAHNISDKSRGVLLHLTIEKMLEDSNPQIIISMPSQSYQDSFSTIFKDIQFKKEITDRSPVAKIIMNVVPEGRDLVISRHNSDSVERISKKFTGTNLADIVYRLGVGQGNIIYRNRTNDCEDLASSISDLISSPEKNSLLDEAADYVEKFIHNKFSLAQNLRKGVAFHYGPLPGSIRVMVENLVKENLIKFIACTGTLAEGVNLPAKNLFLKNPITTIQGKPSQRVEDVKIKNITGRAGRMLHHFSGNIFVVNPDDWTYQDYFDENDEEEKKIPTYFKALNEEFDLIISALSGEYDHDEDDQYRFYTIANKLIKEFSSGNLSNTLDAEELLLGKQERILLEKSVKIAYGNLKVAPFTLDANPTVGYIQQNKLFEFLSQQDQFEKWVLPHPKSITLYESLLNICEKLNEFGVYIPTKNYTLKYICALTVKWIKGDSLKDMISGQIDWDMKYAEENSKNPSSINTSVRDVMKAINNDIRFRFSNALRCYQVLLNNVLTIKGIKLPNVKLHSYIEIGASDDRMINLINMGLSREAAKEIDDNLPGAEEISSSSDLLRLYEQGRLSSVHTIVIKEIMELFN